VETLLPLLLTGSLPSLSLFSWSSLCIRHDLLEDNRSCGSRPTVYIISSLMQNVPWVPRGWWKGFWWNQPPHCRNLVGNLPFYSLPTPRLKGLLGTKGLRRCSPSRKIESRRDFEWRWWWWRCCTSLFHIVHVRVPGPAWCSHGISSKLWAR